MLHFWSLELRAWACLSGNQGWWMSLVVGFEVAGFNVVRLGGLLVMVVVVGLSVFT